MSSQTPDSKLKPPSIQFYHLTTTPLERALPKLLERAISGGYRVLLAVESDERGEQLNQLLWTYDPGSFLPHGSDKEAQPEQQPILISTSTNPVNSSNLLMVTDGRCVKYSGFERILDVFDGNDGVATTSARVRWKEYKDIGHELTYFSQNEQGGWKNSR